MTQIHPAVEDGLPDGRRGPATAAILAAVVLVVLDGAIANVALPTIAGSLHVTAAASIWVVTGYQLAVVVALLPAAALGESLGCRRVFTAGALLFTAASALCAVSPSLPWLVAARVLQGLGGAAIAAIGVALLRLITPRRLLGAAVGRNALGIALSSAAGPVIGAGILASAGWPWLFAVNLPVGAGVLAAARALPDDRGTGRRLDIASVALNAAGFASLVGGVELLPSRPAAGAAAIAASLLCFAALVGRELPRTAPLIPLDLLRDRRFRSSVVASILCFAGQTAGLVALPFLLQDGLRQGALGTGLAMTPWPLAVALAAPLSGRLSDRVATGWLCAGGGLCLAAGLGLAAARAGGDGLMPLLAFTVLCGLGFGVFQTPNNRNMLLSAPRSRSGAAGGLQGMARLMGQTAGAVTMTVLFATAPAGAPRIGLGLGAALAVAAALVSAARAPRE